MWVCARLICLMALSFGFAAARAEQSPPEAGSSEAAGAPKPHFPIYEYRVLGNSVLAGRDIETLLYPLLGEDKSFDDVQNARGALEKLYHDRGFGTVFVDIPPQEVNGGIVRLRVTEATIHERKIDGAHYFSERDIVRELPASKVGTVPNLTELQHELTAVNSQTTDRSVVPILKAGPVPGTLDMELKVTDKLPLHGSIEFNDYYTADTKPLRAAVSLSYGNLFQALDQVSVQYQDTPQSFGQVSVLNASYTTRPFWDGNTVSGYVLYSNSDVPSVGVGANGVLGKGSIAGLRWNLPSYTSGVSTQLVTLGFDYKRFRNTITAGGASTELVTPIKYTDLSLTYTGSWRWNLFDLGMQINPAYGVRGAPNSAADFENDRFLARPNFFYVRWDTSLTFHPAAGYRIALRVAGQDTDEPLISNESYSIGGIDGVRGYLEAEELGDNAIKGSFQAFSPPLSWHIQQLLTGFIFFDAGKTHIYDPLPGQNDHVLLESFGAGLSLLPTRPYNALLIWADPIKTGSYTHAWQSRVLFSVRAAF